MHRVELDGDDWRSIGEPIGERAARSLVELVADFVPDFAPVGLLNGPVIEHETGGDTVSSQAQVDALLNSLGF